MSSVNVKMATNYRDVVAAQSMAESGLAYAHCLIYGYIRDETWKTCYNTVSADEAIALFSLFEKYIQNIVYTNSNSDFYHTYSTTETTHTITFPSLCLSNVKDETFALTFVQNVSDPHMIQVTSVGRKGVITRTVQISYTIKKDNSLLCYAIASESPVVITGDSVINGDILSTWTNLAKSDPILLETGAVVNGDLGTILSEGELPLDGIQGVYDKIAYNQPDIELTDFNTSMYIDKAQNLPASGKTVTEFFPHAAGSYAQPLNANSIAFNRQVYANKTYSGDIKVAAGRNALFQNCVFDGVVYIDVSGNGTNNVRFDNCVFNGPIVTGTPPDFVWKLNTLYFTGNTVFNHSITDETTVLTPNFNVNLGNTQASDTITGVTGLIVGGTVGIRGNVDIDGSVYSMYDPMVYKGSELLTTNIGFYDNWQGGVPSVQGAVHITPSPEKLMPMGVNTKIILARNADQYVEM